MLKIIDSLQGIYQTGFKSKQTYNSKPNFRANDFERNPDNDLVETNTNKSKNITMGVGAVATLVGIGLLGYYGKLGKSFQKFLGGLKEETSNLSNNPHVNSEDNISDKVLKPFNELYEEAIKNQEPILKNELTGVLHEFEYEDGKLVAEYLSRGMDSAERTMVDGNLMWTKVERNGRKSYIRGKDAEGKHKISVAVKFDPTANPNKKLSELSEDGVVQLKKRLNPDNDAHIAEIIENELQGAIEEDVSIGMFESAIDLVKFYENVGKIFEPFKNTKMGDLEIDTILSYLTKVRAEVNKITKKQKISNDGLIVLDETIKNLKLAKAKAPECKTLRDFAKNSPDSNQNLPEDLEMTFAQRAQVVETYLKGLFIGYSMK